MTDHFAHKHTDKARFFHGYWRECWPKDFRVPTVEEMRAEKELRAQVYERTKDLERVCFFCEREIEVGDPNWLLTNPATGNMVLACMGCEHRFSKMQVKATLRDPLCRTTNEEHK